MSITKSTIVVYEYSGSTNELTIPFDYLKRDFVVVALGGDGKPQKALKLGTDYRFATKTTIVIIRQYKPDEGYNKVIIRRVTDASKRIINYQDGSILNASELNTSQLQALHVAEEARDLANYTLFVDDNNNLDARGRKIINLGDPTNPQDAVTKKYVDTASESVIDSRDKALQYRNEAQGFRDEAEGFRNEAESSKNEAKRLATEINSKLDNAIELDTQANSNAQKALEAVSLAQRSAQEANQAAVNAKASDKNASISASLAKQYADSIEYSAFTNVVDNIETLKLKSYKIGTIVFVQSYHQDTPNTSHFRVVSSDENTSSITLANGLKANILANETLELGWFGAKGDGVTDDTIPLQNAIAFYKEGMVLRGVGSFKCKEVTITKSMIIKDTYFKSFRYTTSGGQYNRPSLIFDGSPNVRLEGCIFDGLYVSNKAEETRNVLETGNVLLIKNCRKVTILKTEVINSCSNWFRGVSEDPLPKLGHHSLLVYNCDYVSVDSMLSKNVRIEGPIFEECMNVVVDNYNIVNSPACWTPLHSSSTRGSFTITNSRLEAPLKGGSSMNCNSKYVRISKCYLLGGKGLDIGSEGSTTDVEDCVITDSYIDGNEIGIYQTPAVVNGAARISIDNTYIKAPTGCRFDSVKSLIITNTSIERKVSTTITGYKATGVYLIQYGEASLVNVNIKEYPLGVSVFSKSLVNSNKRDKLLISNSTIHTIADSTIAGGGAALLLRNTDKIDSSELGNIDISNCVLKLADNAGITYESGGGAEMFKPKVFNFSDNKISYSASQRGANSLILRSKDVISMKGNTFEGLTKRISIYHSNVSLIHSNIAYTQSITDGYLFGLNLLSTANVDIRSNVVVGSLRILARDFGSTSYTHRVTTEGLNYPNKFEGGLSGPVGF